MFACARRLGTRRDPGGRSDVVRIQTATGLCPFHWQIPSDFQNRTDRAARCRRGRARAARWDNPSNCPGADVYVESRLGSQFPARSAGGSAAHLITGRLGGSAALSGGPLREASRHVAGPRCGVGADGRAARQPGLARTAGRLGSERLVSSLASGDHQRLSGQCPGESGWVLGGCSGRPRWGICGGRRFLTMSGASTSAEMARNSDNGAMIKISNAVPTLVRICLPPLAEIERRYGGTAWSRAAVTRTAVAGGALPAQLYPAS